MSADAKIQQLNLELPPAPKPGGVYKPVLVVGRDCYVSGHGPVLPDGSMIIGRVGENMSQDEAYQAARQTGLAILATLAISFRSAVVLPVLIFPLGSGLLWAFAFVPWLRSHQSHLSRPQNRPSYCGTPLYWCTPLSTSRHHYKKGWRR